MGTNIFHSCFCISILVLVDSVLQYKVQNDIHQTLVLSQSLFQWTVFCNNVYPYSLVFKKVGRNPCYSGQCFAIKKKLKISRLLLRRNPCFSGQCFAISNTCFFEKLENMSQSLFQWTVFCNYRPSLHPGSRTHVAILVLVDSVLQFNIQPHRQIMQTCRNPCFSGQCFAIVGVSQKYKLQYVSQSLFQWTVFCNKNTRIVYSYERECRNPCFSGQCFAICFGQEKGYTNISRNPCFSGQCFAIQIISA